MPKKVRHSVSKAKKAKSTKGSVKETALIVPTKPFQLQTLPVNLPPNLNDEGALNELSNAKKAAKYAIQTLKTRKHEIIDPIANVLKLLRADYKAACNPWENVLSECRLLAEKHEAEKVKVALALAKRRAKRAEKAGKPELAADMCHAVIQKTQTANEEFTFSRTWKAKIVSEEAVPVRIGQTIIRPIDESALNRLAREVGKGSTILIPGVEFYEEKKARLK